MQVGEGDGVAEPERRHVTEHVGEEKLGHDRPVSGLGRIAREEDEDSPDEEEHAHDDLRRKKTVGDEAKEERRKDRPEGHRA